MHIPEYENSSECLSIIGQKVPQYHNYSIIHSKKFVCNDNQLKMRSFCSDNLSSL